MAIYDGSRYTNVYVYTDNWEGKEVTAFHNRTINKINNEESYKHTWIEGDRLDILANRYYGDPQHWWFILDANPRFMQEHEIQNGDTLFIPSYAELRRIIQDE
jgi:hypothetical protein